MYVDRGGWHCLHVKIQALHSQIQFLHKSSPKNCPNTIHLNLLYFNRNIFGKKILFTGMTSLQGARYNLQLGSPPAVYIYSCFDPQQNFTTYHLPLTYGLQLLHQQYCCKNMLIKVHCCLIVWLTCLTL